MKAIFISDNKETADTMERLFLGNFPKLELLSFMTGQEAFQALPQINRHQFTIIDLNHRSDKILELFQQFSDLAKNRPIIFIGSKALIGSLLTEDIFSRNFANEALEWPLDLRKFRSAIKAALQWAEEQTFFENTIEEDPEKFVPMKINNFFRFNKIPYDVYLELVPPKYVRIIYKDEVYPQSLIIKYAKSNVKYLYLEKNQQLQFFEQSMLQVLEVFKASEISADKIFLEQIRAISLVHEYLRTIGTSSTVVDLTESVVDSIIQVFQHFKNLESIMQIFPFSEKDVATRSLLTAYICVSILRQLQWDSELSRGKLVFAAVIHDCMIQDEELCKIFSKDDALLETLDEATKKMFFDHPLRAAELAQNFNKFPETSFVIAQHHELPSGKGFPNRLSSLQLTSLSCIFILSTNFVNQVFHREVNKKNCYQVLQEFSEVFKDGNFKMPMRTLVTIFK